MKNKAGNINAVTAKIDKTVALVSKICKKHFRNSCNYNSKHSGIMLYIFFVVQTSIKVISMLSKRYTFNLIPFLLMCDPPCSNIHNLGSRVVSAACVM